MYRLLLVLLLISCNASDTYPHKVERPENPYVPPTASDPGPTNTCVVHNDCRAGMVCIDRQCEEPVEPGDPITPPSDPYTPPSDPFIPGDPVEPGDPNVPNDDCSVGQCTFDGTYYLCLEEGYIPDPNPYCDYYTYEGCPDYMTPFIVTWPDGWEDCICIEECVP